MCIRDRYRAFGNIKPRRKIIEYYEEKAKKTLKNDGLNYEEKKQKINRTLIEFINKAIREAVQC